MVNTVLRDFLGIDRNPLNWHHF